jgi:hypothetical protein
MDDHDEKDNADSKLMIPMLLLLMMLLRGIFMSTQDGDDDAVEGDFQEQEERAAEDEEIHGQALSVCLGLGKMLTYHPWNRRQCRGVAVREIAEVEVNLRELQKQERECGGVRRSSSPIIPFLEPNLDCRVCNAHSLHTRQQLTNCCHYFPPVI